MKVSAPSQEIKDMLIADAALTIAFSILFSSAGSVSIKSCVGATGILKTLCLNSFVFYLPIAFVAVTLSFILHEYMHKRVAQHYGAIAGFRRSDMGIIISLFTSLFGFLLALPGATMIYASNFTRKQEGYTSLAGPLTNFAVFAVFFAISLILPSSYSNGYIATLIGTTMYIALWLAFVNMLPIYPLDGSKVLRWNMPVYAAVLLALFGLLYYIVGIAILPVIAIVLVLSIVMSFFARGILFGPRF